MFHFCYDSYLLPAQEEKKQELDSMAEFKKKKKKKFLKFPAWRTNLKGYFLFMLTLY